MEIDPLYPGQSFQIETVAVGQRFGTTPSVVSATFENNSIKVDELQKLQNVYKFCTHLNYTIRSPNNREKLLITVENRHTLGIPDSRMLLPGYELPQHAIQQMSLLLQQLSVSVHLLPCPLGYGFDHESSTCECIEHVTHKVHCDTSTYTILRKQNQWINATLNHIDRIQNHGVLVHNHCPLDYCISRDQSLKLESSNDQCNYNRSGMLCGSCQENLSQIFGTNRCKECSSMWALLVVPVFILLGLVLVVFIITLNLTVAQGTLNALIFYANIISASQATFFPTQTTNSFFRWYIAWLNLDVGVEACFISGLDAYIKTWLQFLFPVYIWVLVILIIVASRYSTLAARLSGENAVPALATLFLLSYTKLLRITITTFSSTQLEYPNGYLRRVWLHDGNIDFFELKHAILFAAVVLMLVFLSIPYTLVLFTIQWLQRLPYHCLLFWVWKLKPLFDAHTGPYKEKHRYWPGLLLLIRALLFVSFSLNIHNEPALNLIITSVTVICMCAYMSYMGGVYKVIHLDVLEYSFLLNLLILTVATFYTITTGGNQEKVIKTSVSIALTTFIIILLGHIFHKVKSTTKGTQFLDFMCKKLQVLRLPLVRMLNRLGIIEQNATNNSYVPHTLPRTGATNTHSSIRLREPLLVE